MFGRPALPTAALAGGLLLLLASCGAGLITGIAASGGDGNSAEARAPELSLNPLMPLVPAPSTMRTVVVANAQIAAAATLRVRIEGAGVGVDQPNPSVTGQGGSTLISFMLDTAAIAAASGDPTAADVPATLSVLVDERPVAPPVSIVLARQPRAVLVLGAGQTERFVSPIGERVQLQVDGLRTAALSELQMLVTTVDPDGTPAPGQPWPTLTRICTDLRFDDPTTLSAIVPGSTSLTSLQLFVRDAVAGQSTTVLNAYYRPEITLALPSQGPTTGGSLVTLIGTALVPLVVDAGAGTSSLSFADIELSFAKGERITTLLPEDFRVPESGNDRLVFTMPASPDGRPGQVDIVLRARVGPVVAQTAASQVFLFANAKPFFGPRGAVLDRTPVAVVPILLDAAPALDATPDFAVLTDQGGVGFLQLLLSLQNGMFQPFAAPRQIGNHEVAAERGPRDICAGDFDGDNVPDMFIANVGAATAVHHLVLGRKRPETPLGAVYAVPGDPGTARCRAAKFDSDTLPDLLLVPGAGAPAGSLPQVLLARPLAAGQPGFSLPVHLPVRPLQHEAVEIADLDGDGFNDVALLRGDTLQLDIAYGNGDGTFVQGDALDLTIPGYLADVRSGAVGLHACRNGPPQSLAVVLAGLSPLLPEYPDTQPTVAVIDPTGARTYLSPLPPENVLGLPVEPLGQSLLEDLDGEPPVEMAIAIAGEPSIISLGLLRLGADAFELVPGGVESGAELPRQMSALHFGSAFVATETSPAAPAVFVVHESEIDGVREKRLSTRLVYNDPAVPGLTLLLPPDAGAIIPQQIEGIVGGNFHPVSIAGAGLVRDLALARGGEIELIENDGFGGFPRSTDRLSWQGLRPRSVALVPVPPEVAAILPDPQDAVDRLVFANADSRIGVWRHELGGDPTQLPDELSIHLRTLSTVPALQTGILADTTRIRVGDVDGDGLPDLVVLLSFENPPPGEGGAAIALMRGKPAPVPGEFPFHEPLALTPVHSNASAIALGDFAASIDGLTQLELAVAVPAGTTPGALDGDHVRFFRYHAGNTPAEDTFQPSYHDGPDDARVLLAGSGPIELAAGDFDRDGLVDLLTAGAGDSALRLLRNVALPATGQPEVDIDAFVEGLTSPQPMPPGKPTFLQLADLNGDGKVDVVASGEFTSNTGLRSTSVAFFLSLAAGEFAGPQFVSPTRLGDRDARLVMDIGDWNRDEVPDLFFGWNTFGGGDRNLRVLFGGTR